MLMRGRVTIAAGLAVSAWLCASLLPASGSDQTPAPARVGSPPERAEAADAPREAAARVLALPVGVDPALLAPPAARGAFSHLRVVDGGLEREVATRSGDLRLRYTLDAGLSEAVWKTLDRGGFRMAHVVVLDPRSGAVLAYASTDPVRFPPDKAYPAASLVKVITAAATLDRSPESAYETCRFVGSPWRLTPARLDPPRRGNEVDMKRALATSNNQCFARWAVRSVGSSALLGAIDRFGMLTPPAIGHPSGRVRDPGEDRYALAELGSGLDGLEITPLHAARLAATLAEGRLVEPRWVVAAWDAQGNVLPVPGGSPGRRVLTPELASQLRGWLVGTTEQGTARRAFRTRRGGPLLQGIPVSGKTGSLNGTDPKGHYEWFIGVAPAGDPRIAVATVAVQERHWRWSASQLAAEVLRSAFCPDGRRCSVEAAERLVHDDEAPSPAPAAGLAQPGTAG